MLSFQDYDTWHFYRYHRCPDNVPSYYCSSSSDSYPTEIRFSIKNGQDPLSRGIKCLFLNMITLGIWGSYQSSKFDQALENNDIIKAKHIFAKGCINEVGEKLVTTLIRKNIKNSLNWLIEKEFEGSLEKNKVGPLATRMINALSRPADLQDFLPRMPIEVRSAMAEARYDAASRLDFEATKSLIENGLDARKAIRKGQHAIFESTYPRKENCDKLRFFLDRGVDPNLTYRHNTVLFSVIEEQSRCEMQRNNYTATMVQLLLERGALPDILGVKNDKHMTALYLAGVRGMESSVELLLNHGADPNFKQKENYQTPYEGALLSGSAKVIQLMHEKGGRTTQKLLNAAFECIIKNEYGSLEKMELLKSYGATASLEKLTAAFNAAVTRKILDKALFLKSCGADTSEFDSYAKAIADGPGPQKKESLIAIA